MTLWPWWTEKGTELKRGQGVEVWEWLLFTSMSIHPSPPPLSWGKPHSIGLKYSTFLISIPILSDLFPDSCLSFSFPISLTSLRQASQLFPLYTHKEQWGAAAVTQGHRGHMVQSECVCVCVCTAYTEYKNQCPIMCPRDCRCFKVRNIFHITSCNAI